MKEETHRTLIGRRRLGTCATLTKGTFLNVVTASCTLGVTTTVNSGEVLLVKGSGNHPEMNRVGAANGETSVYARHFVVDGTGKLTLINLKLSGAWVGNTDAGCKKGVCGYCRKTSCGCGDGYNDCCEKCGAQTACSLECGNDHKGGALFIKSKYSVTTLVDVVFGTNIAFTSTTSHDPSAWTAHFSTGNIYGIQPKNYPDYYKHTLYLSHMSTPSQMAGVVAKALPNVYYGELIPGSGCTDTTTTSFCNTTSGILYSKYLHATDTLCITDSNSFRCGCPLGYYAKYSWVGPCLACPNGKSSLVPGAQNVTDCQACASGQFQTIILGVLSCTNCPAGYYQNQAGQPNCTACQIGKYNHADNSTAAAHVLKSRCLPCQPGYGFTDITTPCQVCASGYFQDSTMTDVTTAGGEKCVACVAGQYIDDDGIDPANHTSCLPCQPGYAFTGTTTPCQVCPGGRFQDTIGNAKPCTLCPASTFIADDNDDYSYHDSVKDCLDCSPGQHSSAGALFCDKCPAGQKTFENATSNQTTCLLCGSGRYQTRAGQTNCENCSSGTYQPDNGTAFCLPCNAGLYQPNVGQSMCLDCAEGHYQESSGSQDCSPCLVGQYQVNSGKAFCFPCIPGKFQELTGQTACKLCPKDTKSENSTSSSCTTCWVGEKSEKGSATCQACGAGTFGVGCEDCVAGQYRTNDIASTVCEQCPIGFSQNDQGQASCIPCIPGEFNDDAGAAKCKACQKGSSSNEKNRTVPCDQCASGRTSKQGSTKCSDCAPGTFQNKINGECDTCPAGWNSLELDAAVCTPCVQGETALAGQPCNPCDVGRFGSAKGICDDCLAGRYQSDKGQTGCIDCVDGIVNEARSSCIDCEVGKRGGASLGTCVQCENGTFQSKKGQASCSTCENGFIPNEAQTACERPWYQIPSDCEPGEFLDDTDVDNKYNWGCVACPLGCDCFNYPSWSNTETPPPPKPGYWPLPPEYKPTQVEPVARCPFPADCLVDKNGTSKCAPNNLQDGVVCAICKTDYVRTNGFCERCSVARMGALVTLISILVLVYVAYRLCQNKIRRLKDKAEHAAHQHAEKLELALGYGGDGMEIFVVFWQISSTSPGILDLRLPPIYRDFLAYFSFVNFDVLGLLGLDCVGNLDYRARVALSCLLPVLIVGASAVVFVKNKLKRIAKGVRTATRKERETAIASLFDLVDANNSGYIELDEFKTLLRELNHQRLDDLSLVQRTMACIVGDGQHAEQTIRLSRQQFIDAAMSGNIADTNADQWVQYVRVNRERSQIFSTAFQLLGLVHAPVSSKLFNYFDCQDISERSFLRADYSLECHTGGHHTFQIVVYLFLIGFTFGLPLALGLVLVLNRKTLRTPKVMEKYGFLYDTYILGAEYWDIQELMRRLLLTGMLLFLPGNTRLAASLLVSISACCLLFGVKPHKANVIQRLEQSSFVILTFKYVGSILLVVGAADEEASVLGFVFIVLDVIYMIHSFICVGSVVHVLLGGNKDPNGSDAADAGTPSNARVVPKASLKKTNTRFQEALKQAVVHNDVANVIETSSFSAERHKEKVVKNKQHASHRLQERLSSRRKLSMNKSTAKKNIKLTKDTTKVERFRALLGTTFKRSEQFRKLVCKVADKKHKKVGRHSGVDEAVMVKKETFEFIVKRIIEKVTKKKVGSEVVEQLWLSACHGSDEQEVAKATTDELSCTVLEAWMGLEK